MNEDRDPPCIESEPVPVHTHQWRKRARAGFEVQVDWRCLEGGRAVEGQVCDLRGPSVQSFSLALDVHPQVVLVLTHSAPALPATFIDVTLELRRADDAAVLSCNLPVSDSEYFNGPIGEWPLAAPPEPVRPSDPDGEDDDVSILAPMDAGDLFPFVWMQPLSPRQADEIALRFVPCADPAALPLYVSLSQAANAAAKIQAAQAFHAGTDFVQSLTTLGPTVARMPLVCRQWLALTGPIDLSELTLLAENDLELPEGTTLADYLAGSEWQTAVPALWQSLFAIALAGTPADAQVAAQMCATLRLGQLLALVSAGADTVPPLQSEAARRMALLARIVLPDAVAAQPPAPALQGGAGSTTWNVLGIGHVRMARHRLAGYAAGELADVVNVMPRERQERQERSVERLSERAQADTVNEDARESQRSHSQTSELADTVTEVMAADGLVRNLSNVTPTYDNLNLSLSGTWAGSGASAGWNSSDSASLVQRVTERAVRRIHDRVSHRRGQAWQALREQRRSQWIDNSAHDRLVGLYHWVDRVVRVRLEPLGQRLVLEFVVAQPAQPWLAHLCDAGAVPLVKPSPLPAPAASMPPYSVVTADNYQTLAAAYGLLDPDAPPPAQVTLTATTSQAVSGDPPPLRIPDGYAAVSGSATLALADSRYALACSVGGIDLPATTATAATGTSLSVPACSASSAGPIQLPAAAAVAPLSKTVAIGGIANATGTVPVTVMTTAPTFAVTVQLLCGLAGGSVGNPRFVGWQMRTYARLYAAWREACDGYAAAVDARIHAASDGHPGETQRRVLQQACLGALASASGTDGHGARDFWPLFAWPHMTWQYSQWTGGDDSVWPETTPSEHLRPPAADGLRPFLQANSARVLLPTLPGWEAWLLWLLQFPVPWAGGPADVPATASTVPLLEELATGSQTAAALLPAPSWTLRVPTTLLYLQPGSRLPPPRLGLDQPLLPLIAKENADVV